MAVHVDLSTRELQPEAVVRLIADHTKQRPSTNILFKVSGAAFELYKRERPVEVIPVSHEEADEMNRFLDHEWQPTDYLMGAALHCKNCGRGFTFYDVFQSGRAQHGDDFIREILRGDEFHLQVAAEGSTIDVSCTACGDLNRFGLEDGHTYYSGSYCYA